MRLYIAGPMTGIEDYNFPEFLRVAKELAEKGHEIYNPATSFSGRQDLPYDMYLRHALQLVTMVEGIVLLDGWSKSRGALTEVHAGLSCVLPFYNYRDGELVEVQVTYSLLTLAMSDKYLEDCSVTYNGPVPQVGVGYTWEAESGEDNGFRSVALPAPKLEKVLIR